VKAAEVRRLALAHGQVALEAAAAAIEAGAPCPLAVAGDDEGEQLTHVMLAATLRARLEQGEEERVAFRAVMQRVRGVLENG
jgi:hypothetical protein